MIYDDLGEYPLDQAMLLRLVDAYWMLLRTGPGSPLDDAAAHLCLSVEEASLLINRSRDLGAFEERRRPQIV